MNHNLSRTPPWDFAVHTAVRSVLLCIVLACSGCAATASRPEFSPALASHLQAVSSRDLPALVDTLTEGETLELYLPSGERTQTRAEFIALHQLWFEEPGWTIQFEIVSTLITRDLALATLKARYREDAQWSENWVTLMFRYESGRWRLVHDQNTRIRSSPAPG